MVSWLPASLSAVNHSPLGKPDLEAIKAASTDPGSEFYYPTLLTRFMANDTLMTDVQFQYFYYGTLFQEDYDPYRPAFRPKQLDVLKPIYQKPNQSRSERQLMLEYALAAMDDNPVNIRQLVNRIYIYEKNGKYDLAKIWQYKLNHILLVIASSGAGTDPETARIVVYPEHEYDLLNLAGYTATDHKFEAPHFDVITVTGHQATEPIAYYFDISEMLHQYYIKHPSELGTRADDNDDEPVSTEDESVSD